MKVKIFYIQIGKKNINYLLKFLEENFKEKTFHIILSSLLYILSDLPKENVIFLQKDEDGNCKNVSKKLA